MWAEVGDTVSTSPERPRTVRDARPSQSPPAPSQGERSCQHPDLGHLVSRSAQEAIPAVSSLSLCGPLFPRSQDSSPACGEVALLQGTGACCRKKKRGPSGGRHAVCWGVREACRKSLISPFVTDSVTWVTRKPHGPAHTSGQRWA